MEGRRQSNRNATKERKEAQTQATSSFAAPLEFGEMWGDVAFFRANLE